MIQFFSIRYGSGPAGRQLRHSPTACGPARSSTSARLPVPPVDGDWTPGIERVQLQDVCRFLLRTFAHFAQRFDAGRPVGRRHPSSRSHQRRDCRKSFGLFLSVFNWNSNSVVDFGTQENIATLEVLADHSQCHYNLAGDRLRSLLRPLLTHWHKEAKEASGSSTHHIDHYLQSQVNAGQSGGNGDEDAKIVDAYEVRRRCCTFSSFLLHPFVYCVHLFLSFNVVLSSA